jgi:putative SOS response-associated peptidase YedK
MRPSAQARPALGHRTALWRHPQSSLSPGLSTSWPPDAQAVRLLGGALPLSNALFSCDLVCLTSFTIMTGPSDGWLGGYHDRAPVILEQDDWGVWLDPAQDAASLLAAVRPERFELSSAA